MKEERQNKHMLTNVQRANLKIERVKKEKERNRNKSSTSLIPSLHSLAGCSPSIIPPTFLTNTKLTQFLGF
jgi:hypothetical protein